MIETNNKTALLIVVLVLVIGAIIYLETGNNADVNVEDAIIPVNTPLQANTKGQTNTANSSVESAMEETNNINNDETINDSNIRNDSGNVNEPRLDLDAQAKRIKEKEGKYDRARELVRPFGYINSEAEFKIADHIGKKVILVDFWTYSCINCQRTLPYLNAWHDKYADDGLLIIGVHAPEFEFEKDKYNVQNAVDKYEIKYPVVLDNAKTTWRAYENRYWPRKYLIDIDGFIVYDHIGEGAYSETEKEIQRLLEERKEALHLNDAVETDLAKPEVDETDFSKIRTPEIYFGYGFDRGHLGNFEGFKPEQIVEYKMPSVILKNYFYLEGSWLNKNDYSESQSDGMIRLDYNAKNVNIVAGADEKITLAIFLDDEHYKDVEILEHDLYNIVSEQEYGSHKLEIEAPTGLKIYTFTFG